MGAHALKEPPVLSRGSTATTQKCTSTHLPKPEFARFSLHSRRSTGTCVTQAGSSNELSQEKGNPRCTSEYLNGKLSLPSYMLNYYAEYSSSFTALLILIHPSKPNLSRLYWKVFPDTLSHPLCLLGPLYVFLPLLIILYYNFDDRDPDLSQVSKSSIQ